MTRSPSSGDDGLRVADLHKYFPTSGKPAHILRGVDLKMTPGDAVAIMGPSGSGKSTLLHILATLEAPSSGKVELGGEDPFQLSTTRLAKFRNRHIGLVFQDHHLLVQCSALENILIPTVPAGGDRSHHRHRAVELLDRIGLADKSNSLPAELSGGERQRIAIARALINSPSLILADEPTGNLDRVTAESIGDLLIELHRQLSNILIVVTHSGPLADRFERVLTLEDGRLRRDPRET
jgi:lipoprotein-releasing system ATP-binding protein